MSVRVAVVSPPPLKPSEPGLSGASAASRLLAQGIQARWVDASMGWHRFVLAPARLRATLDAARGVEDGVLHAMKRAVAGVTAGGSPLRRPETYADRHVYTSAVNDLENALRVAALPYDGFRLGIAMVALDRPLRRLESSATLEWLSGAEGPFDAYFVEELLPALEVERFERVAVSLTFQQQAPAAFRLARLLRDRSPHVERVLGGPLVACWEAAGVPLDRGPFTIFDRVVRGTDHDLWALGHDDLLASFDDVASTPLSVPLDQASWDDYLAPRPTVPAALGRGCSFRRCTFCPDHLHPEHAPCSFGGLDAWLRDVAARFPDGAMVHLTDSALPPLYLERVAGIIQRERLPIAWHGFVRAEEAFADPAFARHLAQGGCAMLQFGVESGSPEMLRRMGKGIDPELSRRILATTAAAGIRNHVYLLFGLPGETTPDRELTLSLVRDQAGSIHAINSALLNLPKGSPMYRRPERFGITELVPFSADTDLSLSVDFRCGASHPRREARTWLARRFFKDDRVRRIQGRLNGAFKANHLCFLAR